MINQTKIVAEKLHVSERHARRLIAECDDRAQRVLKELPTNAETEFYWRLHEMLTPVVELGLAANQLLFQHIEFWQFINEHQGDKDQVIVPAEVVPIIGKVSKAILALPPKKRIVPLWNAFAERDRLLQLDGPWSSAAYRQHQQENESETE